MPNATFHSPVKRGRFRRAADAAMALAAGLGICGAGKAVVNGQPTALTVSGAASLRPGTWSGHSGQSVNAGTTVAARNLFPNPLIGSMAGINRTGSTPLDGLTRSTRYGVRQTDCAFAVAATAGSLKGDGHVLLGNASFTMADATGAQFSRALAVKPSTTYTISSSVYLDGTLGGGAGIRWRWLEYTAAGTTTSATGSYVTTTGTLLRLTQTFTTGATTTAISPFIQHNFVGTLYVSGIQLEEGKTATDLITPQAGGVWTGTEHQSPIERPAAPAWHVLDGTTNQATNPSAEATTTNWTRWVGTETITRTNATAAPGGGAWAVQYDLPATSGTHGGVYTHAISDTNQRACTIWFRGVAGNTYTYTVAGAAGANRIDGGKQNVTATGDWQRLTCTATPQAGDTALSVAVQRATRATAETIWLDNVQIEQRAYATEYSDGDAAGVIQTPVIDWPVSFATSGSDVGGSGRTKIAQSFVALRSFRLGAVRLWLYKVGAPADNLIVRVCADGAGLPGADLGGSPVAVAGSALATVADGLPVHFTFGAPVQLTAGTTYWITLERSGAPDAANSYMVRASSAGPNPNGMLASYSGSWSAVAGWDVMFSLYDDAQPWLWSAYSWSGARHGSTSTRTGGVVTLGSQKGVNGKAGSLEVWFLANDTQSLSQSDYYLNIGPDSSNRVYLGRFANGLYWKYVLGAATVFTGQTLAVTWGGWNHVVVTWDASGWRLYLNGALTASGADTTLAALDWSQVMIGHNGGAGQASAQQHVTMYTRRLTATEIAAAAARTRAPAWGEF